MEPAKHPPPHGSLSILRLWMAKKVDPSPKERADTTTQQVENFMDSMPLKQLMKDFVNHQHPQNTSHDIPHLV